MVVIQKKDLKKIWNWLEKKISPKDKKWLEKYRPGVWCDVPKGSQVLWHAKHAETVYQLSFRIQDVLDAKAGRTDITYLFAEGMPKEYLLELAKMLSLDMTEKNLKWEIINLVLKRIEEEEKEKIRLSFNCG